LVTNNDYDHTTSTNDQETKSYALSYTVTDALSVTYGVEDIKKTGKTADI